MLSQEDRLISSHLRIELEDCFDAKRLAEVLKIARLRVIRAFEIAEEECCGKLRSTDNFIANVGPNRDDLSLYITRGVYDQANTRAGRSFIRRSNLPGHVQTEDLDIQNDLVYRLHLDAINRIVNSMTDDAEGCCIWYMEDSGWNITQSCIDEYLLSPNPLHRRRRNDDRAFHGKNRGQVENRGLPEASSCGTGNTFWI